MSNTVLIIGLLGLGSIGAAFLVFSCFHLGRLFATHNRDK